MQRSTLNPLVFQFCCYHVFSTCFYMRPRKRNSKGIDHEGVCTNLESQAQISKPCLHDHVCKGCLQRLFSRRCKLQREGSAPHLRKVENCCWLLVLSCAGRSSCSHPEMALKLSQFVVVTALLLPQSCAPSHSAELFSLSVPGFRKRRNVKAFGTVLPQNERFGTAERTPKQAPLNL